LNKATFSTFRKGGAKLFCAPFSKGGKKERIDVLAPPYYFSKKWCKLTFEKG